MAEKPLEPSADPKVLDAVGYGFDASVRKGTKAGAAAMEKYMSGLTESQKMWARNKFNQRVASQKILDDPNRIKKGEEQVKVYRKAAESHKSVNYLKQFDKAGAERAKQKADANNSMPGPPKPAAKATRKAPTIPRPRPTNAQSAASAPKTSTAKKATQTSKSASAVKQSSSAKSAGKIPRLKIEPIAPPKAPVSKPKPQQQSKPSTGKVTVTGDTGRKYPSDMQYRPIGNGMSQMLGMPRFNINKK